MKIKVSNVNTPNWKEVTVKSRIPEELEKLSEIARNIWWAWNFEATELFRDLDPELWKECGQNPVLLLERMSYEKLEALAKNIKATALCGLGQTAPNPVLSTLRYFRDEYEAHIKEKRCPAHHCQALLNYVISDKCRGCTLCSKVCPAGAISGEVRKQHHIDTSKCLKCGACMEKCRFGAISKN